jgi:hypothetical protein
LPTGSAAIGFVVETDGDMSSRSARGLRRRQRTFRNGPEPSLLDARIAAGDFHNVYAELQGAVTLGERFFVHDMGNDGLSRSPRMDTALDIVYINGVMSLRCDANWAEQGLTQSDYEARFAAADPRYAAMLHALAGRLRGGR